MAQIRGTAGYNLGHQNPFGGPGSADATSDPSPLDAIREQTSKIEDWLDTMADPVKPYVAPPTHWIQLVVAASRCKLLPATVVRGRPQPQNKGSSRHATDTVFSFAGIFPRSVAFSSS